jgi:hypothetical protein
MLATIVGMGSDINTSQNCNILKLQRHGAALTETVPSHPLPSFRGERETYIYISRCTDRGSQICHQLATAELESKQHADKNQQVEQHQLMTGTLSQESKTMKFDVCLEHW